MQDTTYIDPHSTAPLNRIGASQLSKLDTEPSFLGADSQQPMSYSQAEDSSSIGNRDRPRKFNVDESHAVDDMFTKVGLVVNLIPCRKLQSRLQLLCWKNTAIVRPTSHWYATPRNRARRCSAA